MSASNKEKPLFDLTTSEILKDYKKDEEENLTLQLQPNRKTGRTQTKRVEQSSDINLHSTKGATILNEFISSLLD